MTTDSPLVSICVPTFNGARYLEEALRSAVAQTFDDLEILVVDGGSTDATVEIARSVDHPLIRVVVGERNDGMVANWNRSIELSRGRYVKFLFQDDLLAPTCVERMLGIFKRHSSVGLVFSPRDVIVEDPDHAYTQEWLRYNTDVHTELGPLAECNDGRDIVMAHTTNRFEANRIGEPTCVMIDRKCFEQLGTFNLQVRQLVDVEMWLRVLSYYDAGFVEERLASFRVHLAGATASNTDSGDGWLDQLWIIEGMLNMPDVSDVDEAYIKRQRRRAVYSICRHEARRLKHLQAPSIFADRASLRNYIAYRTQSDQGQKPELHGSV